MVTTQEVKIAIRALAAMNEEASITPTIVANVLELMRQHCDSQVGTLFNGFKSVPSIEDLPTSPSDEEKLTAFIVDKNVYVYVGKGGDTLDGRYQSLALGEGTSKGYEVDKDNSLLIVTADDDTQYACHVDEYTKPETPVITVSGQTTDASRTVTISCATSGATIQYSVDGGESWNTGSSFTVKANTENKTTTYAVRAKAIKNGKPSDIAPANVVTSRHLSDPELSVGNDEYSKQRGATFKTRTDGAKILYSTEGGTPTTEFTGTSFTLDKDHYQVRAISVLENWENGNLSQDITLGKLAMWWGIGTTVPDSDTAVEQMAAIKEDSLPQEFTIPTATITTGKNLYFAVKKSLSVSKMNGGGFDYEFSLVASTDSYNVYAITNLAGSASGLKWIIS